MANRRREYYRKTKQIRMRELKPSASGITAMFSAIAAAVICGFAAAVSIITEGTADQRVGVLCGVGLILAAGALIMGVMGIRQPKVRVTPPRTGIILGVIMIIVYGGLYLSGMSA